MGGKAYIFRGCLTVMVHQLCVISVFLEITIQTYRVICKNYVCFLFVGPLLLFDLYIFLMCHFNGFSSLPSSFTPCNWKIMHHVSATSTNLRMRQFHTQVWNQEHTSVQLYFICSKQKQAKRERHSREAVIKYWRSRHLMLPHIVAL